MAKIDQSRSIFLRRLDEDLNKGLEFAAEQLRNEPSEKFLLLLADMFDAEHEKWRLDATSVKKSSNPNVIEAGLKIYNSDQPREAAVAEVMAEYDRSRAWAFDALATVERVIEESRKELE